MFVDCSGIIISITVKGKDLKMLYSGKIRNAMCLGLQRGWLYWWAKFLLMRKEKSLENLSWTAFEHRVCMGQE